MPHNDSIKAFSRRVWEAIKESKELGYHPTYFIQMLENSDPVSVAKMLVKSGEIQEGLKRLSELGRCDLSIESIMLETEFDTLFSQEEKKAAKWRLSQLK